MCHLRVSSGSEISLPCVAETEHDLIHCREDETTDKRYTKKSFNAIMFDLRFKILYCRYTSVQLNLNECPLDNTTYLSKSLRKQFSCLSVNQTLTTALSPCERLFEVCSRAVASHALHSQILFKYTFTCLLFLPWPTYFLLPFKNLTSSFTVCLFFPSVTFNLLLSYFFSLSH